MIPAQKLRVLVAEDEPYIRRFVLDILEDMPGVEARAVASGEEALAALDEGPWDVLVTDQRMGVTDGVRVLEVAARKYPGTGRIMMTGYGEVPLIERALNEGRAQRFLAKPFGVQEFRDAVASLGAEARARALRAGAFERARKVAEEKGA